MENGDIGVFEISFLEMNGQISVVDLNIIKTVYQNE